MLKPYSFGKEFKLVNFKDCFDNSQKIVGKGLVLYYKKSISLKLGVIVSKKIDKRANKRNKLKRQIREVFRKNKPDSGEIIVIARNNMSDMEFQDIEKDYLNILKKLK